MQGRHGRRARIMARMAAATTAFALAFYALFAPAPSAQAAATGTFSMTPSSATLQRGDTLAVTFDLHGATNVHEVFVVIEYDPGVLEVIDADAADGGVQVLPGPYPGDLADGAILANDVAGGRITYRFGLDGSAIAADSAGTVATARFLALDDGVTTLRWSTRTVFDASGAASSLPAAGATIVVGEAPPGALADTPTATATPSTTETSTATSTAAAATQTPTTTATVNATGTATGSVTATRTATVTRTATATGSATAAATSTARVTILQDSNAGGAAGRNVGVNPEQPLRADGLPVAGNEGPGIAWWRWAFFGAALMLGAAGWFFTFAVHIADREVVLLDRNDLRARLRRR